MRVHYCGSGCTRSLTHCNGFTRMNEELSAAIPTGRRMSTCKTPGDRQCSVIGRYCSNYFSIKTRPSQGWITCGKWQDTILFDQELTLTPSLTASAAVPAAPLPELPGRSGGAETPFKPQWGCRRGILFTWGKEAASAVKKYSNVAFSHFCQSSVSED